MSLNLHLRLNSKFGFKRIKNKRKQKIKSKEKKESLPGPIPHLLAHQMKPAARPNRGSSVRLTVGPAWQQSARAHITTGSPHWDRGPPSQPSFAISSRASLISLPLGPAVSSPLPITQPSDWWDPRNRRSGLHTRVESVACVRDPPYRRGLLLPRGSRARAD